MTFDPAKALGTIAYYERDLEDQVVIRDYLSSHLDDVWRATSDIERRIRDYRDLLAQWVACRLMGATE